MSEITMNKFYKVSSCSLLVWVHKNLENLQTSASIERINKEFEYIAMNWLISLMRLFIDVLPRILSDL